MLYEIDHWTDCVQFFNVVKLSQLEIIRMNGLREFGDLKEWTSFDDFDQKDIQF